MIKYGYIEGDHEPNRLRQFSGAVCDLSKMHTVGFMHGDTKLKNILCFKKTQAILLITTWHLRNAPTTQLDIIIILNNGIKSYAKIANV